LTIAKIQRNWGARRSSNVDGRRRPAPVRCLQEQEHADADRVIEIRSYAEKRTAVRDRIGSLCDDRYMDI
jgi:hypothetical protein